LSDGEILKQYPFDLKAEATAQGYRIHGHVYSDSMEDAVTDLAKMISMAITEFEIKNIPLVANLIPSKLVNVADLPNTSVRAKK
jgi:hypothetical protein